MLGSLSLVESRNGGDFGSLTRRRVFLRQDEGSQARTSAGGDAATKSLTASSGVKAGFEEEIRAER